MQPQIYNGFQGAISVVIIPSVIGHKFPSPSSPYLSSGGFVFAFSILAWMPAFSLMFASLASQDNFVVMQINGSNGIDSVSVGSALFLRSSLRNLTIACGMAGVGLW